MEENKGRPNNRQFRRPRPEHYRAFGGPVQAGRGLNIGVVRGRVTLPGVGEVFNLGFLVRALETDSNTNILSTPTLLTLDNEEARIIIGQNVPFITGQYALTGAATTPTPFQTIERKDVGLTLRVKPQISEGGTVRLQIYQEVSSVVDTIVTPSAGPTTNKRAVESTVLVDDGQIVVIGGLIQDSVRDGVEKVPVLGDIPVLGALFRVYPELAAELPTVENGGVIEDEEAGTMDVTWKLRQDVQWSDGTPLTADDAVCTWEAIMNPETGTWVRGSDYVDSIEKIDEYSFVFHYNTFYPGYLTQLGGEQLVIWPSHYCSAEEGFVAWECGRQPLSTGPFVLQEWAVGDHMTFARNPNYFEPGKPAIDEIIVRIVPDDAVRKTMMFNGDADLNMWATEAVIKELQDAENVEVSISPNSR